MASSVVLLLHIIVAFSAVSAVYARPCKTIFLYYTTTTITSQNYFFNNDNPITRAAVFPYFTRQPFLRSIIDQQQFVDQKNHQAQIRSNRANAILSALLFSVGCGAVTAAAAYLVWSLIFPFGSEEEDEYSDEVKSPEYATFPDDDDVIDAIKKAAQGKMIAESRN